MMTFKRKKFGYMPSAKERDARQRMDDKLTEALNIRGAWGNRTLYDHERETTEELR